MVSKGSARRTTGTISLSSRAYQVMFKETKEAAYQALHQYGEPQMTLEELRQALTGQLGDISLGEWIVKEREAGLWLAVFYFDTSAIVKRYHVEQGTDFVDQVFGNRGGSRPVPHLISDSP